MSYKVDGSRVTLREFWWETKLFFWVGLLVRIFEIRLRASTDNLAVDSLRPFVVEPARIPPDRLNRFAATLQKLQSLGFEPPLWLDEEDVFQATRNTLAVLRHGSGRAWAIVQCRINYGRVPAKIKFFTTFVSWTHDGFIVTGNGKYDMAWPKTHDTVRFRRMSVEEVWVRHQARQTSSVRTVGPGQLLEALEEYHVTQRDFHLSRGVFKPLGEEEFALYPSPAQASPFPAPPVLQTETTANADNSVCVEVPPGPPDLMEVATLGELRRLQTKTANWRWAVVLLLASALVFVLTFKSWNSGQNWEYLAIVVGVLIARPGG